MTDEPTHEAQEHPLTGLDMARRLAKPCYNVALRTSQARLNNLVRQARQRGISCVALFEGWDASGKGGAIRRLVAPLDPRAYRIVAIGPPNDEERVRHYLWRFWRQLPRAGHWTVFDRSWYGRVLVERVEDFASEAAWGRAYEEIRQFEAELVDHGMLVLKYWLHIARAEQGRRFEARMQKPHKSWKLTSEDLRNRERWGDYEAAVTDMVRRTSTPQAPWHLIAGDDKRHARVEVIRRACDALATALGHPPETPADPAQPMLEDPGSATTAPDD